MVAFVKPRNDRLERIAPLASLPVFFDLKEKSVLVAGGSDGAAWKAELLAAAGAEVHVFCPMDEVSEAFQEKLDQFVHHDTFWQAAYFKSFALAIGDCGSRQGGRTPRSRCSCRSSITSSTSRHSVNSSSARSLTARPW
ncbi:NAD(P)-dependent oxidoreductase [Rhizobium rhizogenes]